MDDPKLGVIEDLEDKFFQLPVKPNQGTLNQHSQHFIFFVLKNESNKLECYITLGGKGSRYRRLHW
jgi:hypothetical protein